LTYKPKAKKGFDNVQWIKTTIKTTSPGTEIITALLINMGIYGVEIDDPQAMEDFFANTPPKWDYIDEGLLKPQENPEASVIFYLGTDSESTALLAQVRSQLKTIQEPIGSLALTTETVDDQDWLHKWKKYFHPIKIGRVMIVPEWETATNESEIVFTIDPGSAFGTGQHATTSLCIETLQGHIKPADDILDIGCGSGILSVICLLLGAKTATACDIDPSAVEVTKKNAALNPIDLSTLTVYTGDILTNPGLQEQIKRPYNIIVANIVADVIINVVSLIKELGLLAPGGTFIASGIISQRLDEVLAALVSNNFNILQTKESEGWCCVVANG